MTLKGNKKVKKIMMEEKRCIKENLKSKETIKKKLREKESERILCVSQIL